MGKFLGAAIVVAIANRHCGCFSDSHPVEGFLAFPQSDGIVDEIGRSDHAVAVCYFYIVNVNPTAINQASCLALGGGQICNN